MNDSNPLRRQVELILESVGEGIHVLDAGGVTTFENAASAALLGSADERMVGRRAHDLVHSRRADGSPYPADQCPIHQTIRDGRTRRVEDEVFWRRDGTSFPVDYTCAPLRDDAGAVTGAVVSFRDASERRRAQDALREREVVQRELTRQLVDERARLVAAQAVAKVGSWETDLATLSVIWSEETHRIFETDPAAFHPTHQGFLDKVHPEDREKVNAAFVESLNGAEPRSVEHRIVLPGGRIKVVEERWRAFADETGKLVRAIGTCRDVTERKRTERLLRESEEKFSKLFESSPAKIAIGAMDGTLVDVNRAYAEFFGFDREEMVGRTIADLGIIGEDELRRLLALGRGPGVALRDIEVTMRARGGAPLQVLMSADIISLGGVLHRVATLVDITERKRAEEERRNLQAQSLRAQRMESLGTLAGGIAHDLNNMLSPVMTAVRLLRLRCQDAESDEILRGLEGSVQRAADIVKQVLSFSRGVEGRRDRLDVGLVARDIERIVRDSFPKSIRFELTAAGGLRAVIGDSTQLHQVLLNLCVNARDAMPGGGRIEVALENVRLDEAGAARWAGARPGDYVRITVADAGAGVPAELREKIFEPFFTTKAVGQGTGLGLSTSLAIVKSHGGFIALDGEEGEGSRFRVYLPAAGQAPPPPAAEPETAPRGRGELVLVVDDEEVIRDVTRRTLESFGYRVLSAADGRQALSIFAERRDEISAVITDMAMPVMDGLELIAALRARKPGIAVVGSSGLTSSGELSRATGGSGIHFLVKPYTAETLLDTLRRALDGRAAGA